jgi:hypothetical protein
MKVAAARGQQVELDGDIGVLDALGRAVAAGDDLDAAPAVGLELGEQRVLLGRREAAVACRVGDHRHAAGACDPADRLAEPGPAVRHEAGLAVGEKAAEDFVGVVAMAGFDEEARKVRARNQLRVADILQRAFVGTLDAHLRQPRGHVARALLAATARARQALAQFGVLLIETQADDVHRFAGEADRDFGAGEVGHAVRMRRGAGALLAADLVVIGQRPQFDAVGRGARGEGLGLERAVGNRRVAVQVGIRQMRESLRGRRVHAPIVPPWRNAARVCAGCDPGRG